MTDTTPGENPAATIEDQQQAEQLAGLIRGDGGDEITLSGRCGECGYLLTSAGHEVSCGT